MSPSGNYRIDLRYLGGPFQGWQSQPDGTGVQDHLQKALSVFLRHEVKVVGASRTDTGVHAQHQVASFRTDVPYDQRRWIKSLQGLLPHTVGIDAVIPVGEDFHPIYSATQKVYRYLISCGIRRNPFFRDFAWEVYQDLDANRMEKELQTLVGSHDFTSFCAADSGAKTRQRTIREVALYRHGQLIELWIRGDGFLKQMIRIIAGTLVHLELGKLDVRTMRDVIAAQDRTVAGITAPGQGLALMRIFYDEPLSIASIRDEASRGLTFLP